MLRQSTVVVIGAVLAALAIMFSPWSAVFVAGAGLVWLGVFVIDDGDEQ